jgi:hypothetical protein
MVALHAIRRHVGRRGVTGDRGTDARARARSAVGDGIDDHPSELGLERGRQFLQAVGVRERRRGPCFGVPEEMIMRVPPSQRCGSALPTDVTTEHSREAGRDMFGRRTR